jgi:hypothetical protein
MQMNWRGMFAQQGGGRHDPHEQTPPMQTPSQHLRFPPGEQSPPSGAQSASRQVHPAAEHPQTPEQQRTPEQAAPTG